MKTKLFNIIAATFLVVLTIVSIKAFAASEPGGGNGCQGNGHWENDGNNGRCPAGQSYFICYDGGTDCIPNQGGCGGTSAE